MRNQLAEPVRAARGPGGRAVRRQLETILGSSDFDASRRSREFLRFIVEETLAGRGNLLTQGAIATSVFGRWNDFDPVVDPIVRIQAGRLRRSLERYYLLSGRHDILRIDLPKGSYVPTFRASVPTADDEPERARLMAPTASEDGWPVVMLGEFAASAELRAVAARMSDELMIELGRYGVVRVLRQRGEAGSDGPAPDRARFAFGARLDSAGDSLRVTAHLTDRWTGHELWGDEYVTAPARGRAKGSSEDVARVIAARIGAEEGVVVQHLASERRKRRTDDATPYDALLLSYEAFFGRDPDTLRLAVDALRAVVKADPDCGWAWSRLARLCVANYTLEVTAAPTPLDEAIACAEHGVRADQSSRHARCTLALVLLIKGELAAARAELEKALRSSPDSLAYLEVAGLLLTMLGEWDRGREVLKSAVERNPHCLPSVHLGLWAAHLHRGELEEAHQAALAYRDPMYFLRSAMRASCLGLLGRKDEGRLEVERLLAGKPDFATRGRVFLGHYVKSPEVMERIVHGLSQAGLTLD